jgi:hypothetical protein
MNGKIRNMIIYNKSLNKDEVSKLVLFDNEILINPEFDEFICYSTLTLLLKGIQHFNILNCDPVIVKILSDKKIISGVFQIYSQGDTILQRICIRTLTYLLSYIDIETVLQVGVEVGIFTQEECFIDHFVKKIGKKIGSVGSIDLNNSNNYELNPSNENEFGLIDECISLLKSLCTRDGPWKKLFRQYLINSIIAIPKYLSDIAILSSLEIENKLDDRGKNNEKISILYGILSILDRNLVGMYIGSLGTYINNAELKEECIILGPTVVPEYDKKDKELCKLWNKLQYFGDIMMIELKSQPGKILKVPRYQLYARTSLKNSTEFNELLQNIDINLITNMIQSIINIDTYDPRPVQEPLLIKEDIIKSFENEHSYDDSADDVYIDISFLDTDKLTIEFDSRSSFDSKGDYIRFYKNVIHTEYYGENKYFGKNSNNNFPGVNNNSILNINSNSAIMYFHSDSNTAWGYKFTVKATITTTIKPPEPTYLVYHSLLTHLKMEGLKTFQSMLKSYQWILPSCLHLSKSLFSSALCPVPLISANVHRSSPVILESSHPYENYLDQFFPVYCKGAEKLSISFDPQTKTEHGCDYCNFYTDSSHSTLCPGTEENYTGNY